MEIAKELPLLVLPIVIAIGQILFKLTSRDVASISIDSLAKLSVNGYFVLAVLLYGLATIFWVYTLKNFPLSRAYLFMGLSFVFVPLLSYFLLKEPLSLKYMAGAGCIVFGVWLARSA